MRPAGHREAFSCTFCRSVSAGPPRVLGRSARLTCEACYSALLDLSICWVCGELIFRGSECVSFDWCFWHRACYGCLLCGSRRVRAGVPSCAVFSDGYGLDDASQASAGGKEVVEPPLCAVCANEIEAAGLDEGAVVRRGLRRVSIVDGGVTQARWDRGQDQQSYLSRRARATQEVRSGMAVLQAVLGMIREGEL